MGLERAVTLRQFHYEEILRKLDEKNSQMERLSNRMSDTTWDEKLKQAQANLNSIAAQADQEHKNIAAQILDVENEIQGQRTLTPEAARTRDELTQKVVERDRLIAEREGIIKDRIGEFERQRESFVERIKMAQANGDNDKVKRYEGELEQLPNTRSRYETQYAAKVDPLEKNIATLRAEFDRQVAAAPAMSLQDRQKLESKRDDLKN